MAHKLDPLRGMNPDQSGPVEKVQNGDPHSSPNRDQRSGAAEAGGPGPSLQKGPTGTKEGQVPPHDNLVTVKNSAELNSPVDFSKQEPAGSLDRAGMNPDTGVPYNDPSRRVDAKPSQNEDADSKPHEITDDDGGEGGSTKKKEKAA